MKKFAIPVIFTFFIMLSHLSMGPLSANAAENECILEAGVDVIVEVWNVDKQGNKGPRIWKGLIKKGEQKRISSAHGRIRYARSIYVKEDNKPVSGDIGRPCNSEKIIRVP